MMKIPFTASVLALALATLPGAAFSQAVVQALPGSTDADRLAATMRRVAAAPTDVRALIEAAELSVRLDDASAAASLFARAEKIDPQNGRVKAGMGAILVRAERPGEALRYFNQAEGYGWPAFHYASDRGLAYDLLGEQERAQRDYRLALQAGADDETLRRYALSLAISGRRDPALEQLQPMVRRQDRGAWRTQAFVLALTGDPTGADRIATSMMPAAAAGLAAFFRRLPSLPAVDRAFAVHFGEVRAGPDRLADARLAPALAALAPEADPFARRTQVASVQAVPVAVQPSRQTRQDRRRGRRGAAPVQTAAVVPVPVPAAAPAPPSVQVAAAPPGPVFQPPAAVVQALPPPDPVPVRRAPPVQVAAAVPRVTTPVRDADSVLARIVASIRIPASELEAAGATELAAGRREVARERADRAAAVRTIRAARPAAERAAAKQVASKARAEAPEAAPEEEVAARPTTRRGRALAAKEAAAREKATEEEVAAARPATKASTKVAARKKAAPKETPAQRAAKAEPERIWVQVAGGANEGDLGKAWSGAKKQASALSGRAAYTTKSRATNRVVTGPFKTEAEARAFVNKLRGQGVGAFSFTSDAGQKMAKLPAK